MRDRPYAAFSIKSLAAALALVLASTVGAGERSRDHDEALRALQTGEILSLRTVLDRVELDYPGQILEVEFERDNAIPLYEIKLMQTGGKIVKLKIDARDGSVLSIKQRDGSDRGKH